MSKEKVKKEEKEVETTERVIDNIQNNPEEKNELSEVEILKKIILEEKDKYLRALAESENVRKRYEIETISKKNLGIASFISEILDPLELLDRELRREVEDPTLKNYLIGFKMINDMLFKKMMDNGLLTIDEKDVLFDPLIHEALEKESDLSKKNGTVLEVLSKGYKYKSYLVKPAKVKVNEWEDKEDGKDK
ncbi:MAG: nucleotide exchange factor GrpE [Acholeplasmatales bacterium]|nr:nucleotide exchange factor GrpE [Acholeplasmatales bacterium]